MTVEKKKKSLTEETSDRTREKEEQDKTLDMLVDLELALKPRTAAERYKEDSLLGMDCDLTHSVKMPGIQ